MSRLPRLWCPQCREWTVLIDTGHCLWCSGRLQNTDGNLAPQRPRRRGVSRNIPDSDIVAAHREHMAGTPLRTLAAARWDGWGYASVDSCREALRVAFRRLGLPARRVVDGQMKEAA